MRAAFLVRCSTDKQDYDRQLKDLSRVAESFNFTIGAIFGEYITGKDDTTKGDRRSIKKLFEAAERKEFDVLLVNEVSRMSRDGVSGRVYIRRLNNLGLPTYFRDRGKWTINYQTNEVDTAFEKELGIYFDGAAEYLKSMKTFTASGRRNRLRDNQLVNGKIYGYKKLGGNDKYTKNTVVINEEEAEIIRYAYNKYLEVDSSLKSTAISISSKFGIPFSLGKVYHILCNKSYHTGYTTVTTTDPDTKAVEVFKITFDTIIDESLYIAAQNKLKVNKGNKTARGAKQKTYLLSRCVKCSFCGKAYSPTKRANGKITWRCHSRINNSNPDCKANITFNDEKATVAIWDFVKKEILLPSNYDKEEKERRINEIKNKINEAKTEINTLSKESSSLDKTIEKAYTAYLTAPEEASSIALSLYNKTLSEVQNKKDEYNEIINKLELKIKYCITRISNLEQSNFTEGYIKEIEADERIMREIFIDKVESIYPYKADYRKTVFDIRFTSGENYYLLLDSNQRTNKTAYYISGEFAKWQNALDSYNAYESGDYFIAINASLITDTEELELFLSFEEVKKIAEENNWVIDYSYHKGNIFGEGYISNIELYNKKERGL